MRPLVLGVVDASADLPPMHRVAGDDLATLAHLDRLTGAGTAVMVDTTAGLAGDDQAASLTRVVWAFQRGAAAVAVAPPDVAGAAQAVRLLHDEVAG